MTLIELCYGIIKAMAIKQIEGTGNVEFISRWQTVLALVETLWSELKNKVKPVKPIVVPTPVVVTPITPVVVPTPVVPVVVTPVTVVPSPVVVTPVVPSTPTEIK